MILSDVFTTNPNDIGRTKVLTTIASGKVIYETRKQEVED